MEVSRKLLIYGAVAFVGLLMQVVIFTSPGWTHVHIPVRERHMKQLMPPCKDGVPDVGIAGEDSISLKEPCRIMIDEGGILEEKSDSSEKKGDDNDSAEKHGFSSSEEVHDGHHHHEPHVCISLGLWYLVTCSHVPKNDDKEHHCQVSSYDQIYAVANAFPTEISSLSGMVKNIGST